MNPCDICGKRTLIYPGVCDPCNTDRHQKYKTDWQASHEAATSKHEPDPWAGFNSYLPDEPPPLASSAQMMYLRNLEHKAGVTASGQLTAHQASTRINRLT